MITYWTKTENGIDLLAKENDNGDKLQISFDETNNIAEVRVITDLTGFDPSTEAKYQGTRDQVKALLDQ